MGDELNKEARLIIKEIAEHLRGMKMVDIETKAIRCKYCGSLDVVKFGTYKGVQRWWCKDCKRKFAGIDTIPKMQLPDKPDSRCPQYLL